MTKEDLKTLAQLPKVIAVLRKLASEASEVEKLLRKLNVMPKTPPVPQGTPAERLHEIQQALDRKQVTRVQALGAAVSDVPLPADLPTPERAEFEAAKEEKRAAQKAYLEEEKAAKQAFMTQFAHDGGSDKDEAVRREQLTTLAGS